MLGRSIHYLEDISMTCREAIVEVFANEAGILSTNQVIDRINARYPDYPWRKATIQAHLIGLSVNHQSSRYYPSLRQHAFLFSLGNGRYRRWNPEQDGAWEVTTDGVQVAEENEAVEVIDEIESDVMATSLSLERDLENSLISNLARLEPKLRLYNEKDISGQQFDTGSVGRLDLLCVDQNEAFVVVEIKAGRAEDRVCGQILRYMGWVKENLTGSHLVRGIIVANDFSDSLKFAVKAMPNVLLKMYEVRFDFKDV
jgi:hypothetical protein